LLVDGRLPAVDLLAALLAVLLTPPVDLRDFPAVDFGGIFAISNQYLDKKGRIAFT
jgi:hypothetical protein